MRRGRFFWRMFLGHAVLLAAVWALCICAMLGSIGRYRRVSDGAGPLDDGLGGLVWTAGLVGILAAVALAFGLARLWSGRIARLTAAANAIARGDMEARLDASGSDEVALLARSLNRMADRWEALAATIDGQQQMLDSLLGQLGEGVVIARADGRIVLTNPAAARLLNMPRAGAEPAVGRDRTVEQYVPQHDLQRLLLPNDEVRAAASNEARLDLAAADGPVSILARASDIALPGAVSRPSEGRNDRVRGPGARDAAASRGPVTGRLLVLNDVSELSRAIRLRTDFVANASHELRTPLSAIRAAAETLLKMNLAAEHEVVPRFIDVIARQVARLEALVGDLLDLSRVESPGGRFERSVLRLHRVADDIRERWSEAAQRKGVELRCEVEPGCTTVAANPRLLALVVDNLLENAVKFTEPGGHVLLQARCTAETVTIEVRDDGCGIPPEEHERVFERFYQVSSSRSSGDVPTERRGTGLGLSIVRHAVAAMEGNVRLESALGKGTSVTVSIPAACEGLDSPGA